MVRRLFSVYMSGIRPSVARSSPDVAALTSLTDCYNFSPVSADDKFLRDHAMYYHVCVIIYMKHPQLSVKEQDIVSQQQASVCPYIFLICWTWKLMKRNQTRLEKQPCQ